MSNLEKLVEDYWPEANRIQYTEALRTSNPVISMLNLLQEWKLPIPINYGYVESEWLNILCQQPNQYFLNKHNLLRDKLQNITLLEMLENGVPGTEVSNYAKEHCGDWETVWRLFTKLNESKKKIENLRKIFKDDRGIQRQLSSHYRIQQEIQKFKDTSTLQYK